MDSDATEIETEDIAEEDGTDDMEMPEFETEEGGNDDAEMTLTEDMEVGVGEPGVNVEDEGLAIGEDYQYVISAFNRKFN
jgi:hypothetical protein